ncbi:MAG: hypothetical protein JWP88_1651 [Flaviaesturariibacter sp.]|nr:hypothetical protein [Flaviaesturariibacter sp.]
MAEWLGSALQKLLQRFESARYLTKIPFCGILFLYMLTAEEKAFVDYWAVQRLKKKSIASRLSSGLPMGVLIVVALFASILTGWYKRATMIIQTHGSVILLVVIAAIAIVWFMSYFSAQHEWDQSEERYQFLLTKQSAAASQR